MEDVQILIEGALRFLRSPVFISGGFGTLNFWIFLSLMGGLAGYVVRTIVDS